MRPPRALPVPCLILAGIAAALPAAAQDLQTRWTALPAITTSAPPALAAHDLELHAVAIAFNGLVAATHTATPGGWAAWEILGPAPCSPQPCVDPSFRADPPTAPVLFGYDGTLYVFARGIDDNLYALRRYSSNPWATSWTQVTTEGTVRGRFSVVVTRSADGSSTEFGILYPTGPSSMEFRLTNSGWNEVGPRWQWSSVIGGMLGTDGENQIVAALRTADGFVRVDTHIRPFGTAWQPMTVLTWPGPLAETFDLSNVEFFGNAYHFVYATSYLCDDVNNTYCHQLVHAAVPLNGAGPELHEIQSYVPSGGMHPLATLRRYRQKLVAAYTDVNGWVRYARWDTSDPARPWVRDEILNNLARSDRRPALGLLDRRSAYTTTVQWDTPNFDDDLFAGIVDLGDAVQYLNLSRTGMTLEFAPQILPYDKVDGYGGTCHDYAAATPIADAFTDGRPFMTEMGFNLWMLPEWLSDEGFQDAAERGCLDGNASGRFDPPCSATRYPVIMKDSGGLFVCDGAWLNLGAFYDDVWEELGHSLATGVLGFIDDSVGGTLPTQWHADHSGIALADLYVGHYLFGLETNLPQTCNLGSDPVGPNPGRCRGFTGFSGNYDVGSRQHSWMYALHYYVVDGDQLRDWVQRDLDVGIDLLQQKYDWIRTHIFRGVEFREHSDPRRMWDIDCQPDVTLTCGSTYTVNSAGGHHDVDAYACNGFDYSGPEVGHVLRVPTEATVTVTMTGLSADLDLLLLDPPFQLGCDTGDCVAASTSGGTGNEQLVFAALPGEAYHLMVDGYLGASSSYTLTVSCEGASPGGLNLPYALLHVSDLGDGDLGLSWGPSCWPAVSDYAVYEGALGSWYDHEPALCSTGGAWGAVVTPQPGNRYFLVVPQSGLDEGSYGLATGGERPASADACLPTRIPGYCLP